MIFNYKQKFVLAFSALKNLLSLSNSKLLDPPMIVWLITHRCNFKCNHCDSWKDKTPLENEKYIEVAKKIAKSNTKVVSLTGGEILIIPNIKEIIKILKDSGKIVKINTNGYLLDKYIDFFLDIGLDVITTSIDGYSAELHDSIRNKKGSYDIVLKNFKTIMQKRVGKKPYLSIRGVIMKENIDTVEQYINELKDYADDIGFQPLHNEDGIHKISNEDVLFDKKDEEKVNDKIELLSSKYDFLNNGYFNKFPKFMFHKDEMKKEALEHCLPILFNVLRIDHLGNCYTCKRLVGNIYKEELNSIWTSSIRMNYLKQLACEGKCENPCWVNSSVISSPMPGKIYKKLLSLGYKKC